MNKGWLSAHSAARGRHEAVSRIGASISLRRRKRGGLALLLGCATAALFASPALAIDTADLSLKTTEDLFRVCTVPATDPAHTAAIDLCEGFVTGAVSYHDAVSDRQHMKRLICYPSSATRDQGVEAFITWAASHQQDQKFMADPAVVGVVRGLASKWPCH